MKIAVINFSGNVGKTTVSINLLKARMPDAPVYSIESLNSDGAADGCDVERMRGRKYGELQEQIMLLHSAIVDVGASNAEEFLKFMQQYAGSHEEFDYFLVPVVKQKKQMADTVNTIRLLAKIGIPRQKIRLIFNMVEVDDALEDDFAPLFGLATSEKAFTLNPNCVIHANEVFGRLKEVGRSLGEVSNDPTDYRAALRQATGTEEKESCVKMIAIRRLAVTANKNLDDVFNAVFQ